MGQRTPAPTSFTTLRDIAIVFLAVCALTATSLAQTNWVGSWATSQQLLGPNDSLTADDLRDMTLRQIVHLSLGDIGGRVLRVRLSNRFGATPLRFTSVHIARPVSGIPGSIVAGTDEALSFSGNPDVWVPAGADYISDPIAFLASPLSDLAITLRIDGPIDEMSVSQTGHPGSHATSYLAHGDQVSALSLTNAKKMDHWYFISGVDVASPMEAGAVVALGDSITDGHGASLNGNDRWPDFLAKRSVAEKREIGVLNQGIGGNRLLLDGIGPNALARFDHDVLAQTGVRYVILLEGINDLGMLGRTGEVSEAKYDALVQRIIGAYEQIIYRAHAHQVQIFGATILPFTGSEFYHPDAKTETARQAVNRWIRSSGHFDAVIDFDKTMRDPEDVSRLLPSFDSGDHLHPSPAGYAAMGGAVPLELFSSTRIPGATEPRIAITFDDLPAHGSLPLGMSRLAIASKILTALREAAVPPTYGFVNGLPIEQRPEEIAVLDAWRTAGQPLGNHTWSHMDLGRYSLDEFESDASHNEPLLAKSMKGEDWRWFRFPFLSEGDTPAKRSGVRSYLAQRGYKVAAVTMSFADYQWTEPYARCKAKNDPVAIKALEDTYLSAADESISYYRSLSHTLFGRDIPYVLLLHIGALDAEMLPRLLQLYRSEGFTFVSLAEAESDEFYRGSVDPRSTPQNDTLEGAMTERGLPLPARASFEPLLDAVCR
jgi:lysophospholipase L1-like esterase